MLVARWDKEEQDDDVDFVGSSTFGAHKIVKMPLSRQVLNHEDPPCPSIGQTIDSQNNDGRRRSSESSTGSSNKVSCGLLKHTVHIEVTHEKAKGEIDIVISNEENRQSVITSLGCQQQNNSKTGFYLSTTVSSDIDLLGKDANKLKRSGELMANLKKEETLQNEEEIKLSDQAPLGFEPSARASKLVPILESQVDEDEAKLDLDTEGIQMTGSDASNKEVQNALMTNKTVYSESSQTAPNSMSTSSPQEDSAVEGSAPKENGQDKLSRSFSSNKKRRLSNFKAVINSIAVMKTKTLRAKKVGFLGEVSGDRTQSDNDRQKRRRVGLFSYSESGAASKSSNTRYYSSYASYMSIDSTTGGGSHRQPEDQGFPQDTTSCTIATVLMGFILAVLILPATFRHAVRMFGSPVSSQPTINEINLAIMYENLVKFAAVYKFFLCVITMSSFRHALVWLVRQWVPAKLFHVSNFCCRNGNEADTASSV
ncbi:hypothetical protein ElyMa_001660300 [Elysia marginata]|uniref:G-protein coupled receptors family 1 profile domain-containing protein n=1 Tax=Elysia marginata TaxID=1093978 RepID=A0AAV4JS37_9GAST|nr:hypothetical protein ElyMa_001660300 [Elysia marginata]